MPTPAKTAKRIISEHSIPIFWPLVAAVAMGQAELEIFRRNLRFIAEAEKISHGLTPQFVTANIVSLELHTLRLRDFSPDQNRHPSTVVVTPYAGHASTIADYHKGQSLVETLLANGLRRVLITDWKNATLEMKDYDIDNYLAELNVCIDDLGPPANLIGLCQGAGCRPCLPHGTPPKCAPSSLQARPSIPMPAMPH
jgi:poly(3-hydroxybutyrate) depolymerase